MPNSVLLSAENLTFGYPNAQPLLDGWTQSFDRHEMVAITGPSGRGKSTLLYILGLMLAPESGRILLGDTDVTRLSDKLRANLRAQTFGFVFQDAALDPTRSVLDNVIETALYRCQPQREAEKEAQELLEQFGVHLRANAKPGQVSGGQAQRIALCRALLNSPEIVLADEPTGNLDPASSALVIEALRQHSNSGGSVIIVTHDPKIVSSCDREVRL